MPARDMPIRSYSFLQRENSIIKCVMCTSGYEGGKLHLRKRLSRCGGGDALKAGTNALECGLAVGHAALLVKLHLF
jgi:hypothetical protein